MATKNPLHFDSFDKLSQWLYENRYVQRMEGEATPDVDPEGCEYGWEGGCPCSDFIFYLESDLVYVTTRCWRVSKHKEKQDLYVWSPTMDPALLNKVAEEIRWNLDAQEWYSPYRILIQRFN